MIFYPQDNCTSQLLIHIVEQRFPESKVNIHECVEVTKIHITYNTAGTYTKTANNLKLF